MKRLTIQMTTEEKSVLFRLAEFEKRDPRQQAALLIRQRLETLGLLPTSQPTGMQVAPKGTGQ